WFTQPGVLTSLRRLFAFQSNADFAPCSLLRAAICDESHRQRDNEDSLILRKDALKVNTANCARLPQGAAMHRTLVWIEEQHFLGFGCSECGWRFELSGAPTGTSFDEMKRNFELQRDKAFTAHLCANHSQKGYPPTKRHIEQTKKLRLRRL